MAAEGSMLDFTPEEIASLKRAMHHARQAHVRRKATALWNLAQGRKAPEVAAFLDVSLVSLRAWLKRYQAEGIDGFGIKRGRGRPARADPAEIEALLRQSPRVFGFNQTRWTLRSLSQAARSLKGFSLPGVRKALQRNGFHYKRGQPHLTSPDPAYAEKRAALWQRFEKPAPPLARSSSSFKMR